MHNFEYHEVESEKSVEDKLFLLTFGRYVHQCACRGRLGETVLVQVVEGRRRLWREDVLKLGDS